MIKKITPPTILKLFTEMPKKENSNWPESAKAMIVINATMVAFLAVLFLSFTLSSAVMVIKMGILLSGLISVKNEVKHKSPKVSASFMVGGFIGFSEGETLPIVKVRKVW
jgi:hypothetical protein